LEQACVKQIDNYSAAAGLRMCWKIIEVMDEAHDEKDHMPVVGQLLITAN